MRAFVGIDFDQDLKSAIGELQREMRPHAVKGRWKHVDNFHLTLKFLNEITVQQKEQIGQTMGEICAGIPPFILSVSGLDFFTGKDLIRVLWLGLEGEVERLGKLQQEMDSALYKLGFDREKRAYKPHVTIGQDLQFDCDPGYMASVLEIGRMPVVRVENLYLFKSEQVGNRRIYSKADTYPLGGSGK